MPLAALARRAVHVTATGAAGVIAVDGVRRLRRSGAPRAAAVTVTAWGLRGWRQVEVGAESARLAGADVLSEARAAIGEQAPPPSHGPGAAAHDH